MFDTMCGQETDTTADRPGLAELRSSNDLIQPLLYGQLPGSVLCITLYNYNSLFNNFYRKLSLLHSWLGQVGWGLRRFCKVLRLTRHSSHSGFRQRWKGWKEEVRKAKDRKGKEGDEK